MNIFPRLSALQHLIRKSLRYWQANGIRALGQKIYQKISAVGALSIPAQVQTLDFYEFVKYKPEGGAHVADSAPLNTINWFIPPFGFGSGGHLNIFRFIQNLEREGFSCAIIIVGENQLASAQIAQKLINEWFMPLKANVFLGAEQASPAHITVATSWVTAYYVRNFRSTHHHCYFVQDFEPYFYAIGSEYILAEATYRFGFHCITAGDWLAQKLAQDYGLRTSAVGFSYDRDLYAPLPRKDPSSRTIFFYARPPTQRRAFELGLLVLDAVIKRHPDVGVVFAGWDISNYAIPFNHINAGVMKTSELPDLYSQCDAALVLSLSNLSLLPLELMACGTPVVSNRAPCTEWLLNDDNAALAEPTVEALADALSDVLSNSAKRAHIRAGGFATIARSDWADEGRKMADFFRKLDDPTPDA